MVHRFNFFSTTPTTVAADLTLTQHHPPVTPPPSTTLRMRGREIRDGETHLNSGDRRLPTRSSEGEKGINGGTRARV